MIEIKKKEIKKIIVIILNFIISTRGGLAPGAQVLSYPLHIYVCPQWYLTLL
jgi:hypothetical protein